MRGKMVLAGIVTLLLLGALGLTLWVTQQQQEIRSKAVNDVEFMLVTAPVRKKHNKSQIGVVLDKLDRKFKYRLVFTLTYTQTTSGTPSISKPKDKRKTITVHEEKTHKFIYRTPPSCDWVANLEIQLYYRERKRVWQPVNAATAKGNIRQTTDCNNNIVEENAAPPDESSLDEPEGEAADVDNLENQDVIDTESAAAATEAEPTALPTNPPTGGPTSTNTPTLPSPTSAAGAIAPTNTQTPSQQNTATRTSTNTTITSNTNTGGGAVGFFGNLSNSTVTGASTTPSQDAHSQTASPTRTPTRPPAGGPTPSIFGIPTLIATRTQYLVDTSNAQGEEPNEPTAKKPTSFFSKETFTSPLAMTITAIVGATVIGGLGISFVTSKIRDLLFRPKGPVLHPETPMSNPPPELSD